MVGRGDFRELERGSPSPSVLQASRKTGTRGKAAATKQAQRGSSNVFSMFEQAQIQEFKEVSTVPPAASHSAPLFSEGQRFPPTPAPHHPRLSLTSASSGREGGSSSLLKTLLTGLQLH